ncbi:hypothetical protein BKA70DRAFT_1103452 [Coprinopsis sp. MPI-PUGE-AT-0042]|nr:hypothetical protein BKA70DRAFT_1103452 [Coprinopsis sp. MPI-PUGE-AT-0042]
MLKQQQDRVRFRATAKLSKEGDHHLPRERENYESFPGHWYERWTGLNLVPPFHDPVPCGPVVPQYYGYYVPTASVEGTMAGGYRSPIMLLEDCGKQVVIHQLNDADRDECASLFFRMHEDRWVHNSPFERNVMVDEEEVLVISHVDEKGAKRENLFRSNGMVHTSHWAPPPPTPKSFPRTKGHGVKTMSCGYVEDCEVVKHVMKTFRLIDFGRSVLTDVERDGDGLCTKEGDLVVAGFKVGGRR